MPLKMKNLPTVSVRDLLIHPKENDLVIGTHGQSIYILDDISFLQQFSNEVMDSDIHLFNLQKAWGYHLARDKTTTGGAKAFVGKNPDYGALIAYFLKTSPGRWTMKALNQDIWIDSRQSIGAAFPGGPKQLLVNIQLK